jgi:hypothetical protein
MEGSMNIKRGLLRLWIVCSAIWATLSIAILHENLTALAIQKGLAKNNTSFDYVRTADAQMVPLKRDTIQVLVGPNSFLLFGTATPKEEAEKKTKSFYEGCRQERNGVWTDNFFIYLDYYPNQNNDQFNIAPLCQGLKKIGVAYGDYLVPNWGERTKAAGVIVMPPVLIYLLGLLIVWVIRGFKT